jgi:ABC-2 type transport system ATP-binding protein
MNDDTAIKLENVSKDFLLPHQKANSVKSLFTGLMRGGSGKAERQHALRDISFEVKKGEFFGIVGRNGSGKSTLLKIIAEIYRPTKGAVTKSGRLVPFIELGVGFNPELTGRENVYLNGALLGFSTREIDEQYDDIVQFAELEQFMDQKLKNYSSGMQVRLAFSVATRAKAEILLIDEVLAVGDADFQRKCFQYFRSLKNDKTTVIFVSHDMEAVREYCDRCVLLDSSEIIYSGSPEVAAEKYVQLFNTKKDLTKTPQPRNDERWGDGAAEFTTVSAHSDVEKVVISGSINFNKKMVDPIFGFTVKNSAGDTLCGTNNKILRLKTGNCTQDTVPEISWTIPNIFGDDEYFVDVAITHRDGVTQADWWHNAASFRNVNEQSTPHPVSPKVKMRIN